MARLPSDPSRLSGHRKHQPFKLIKGKPAPQPELPDDYTWPEPTVEWWRMWGRSALTDDFTENDWSELLDTARLHAKFWNPKTPVNIQLRCAAELRQRAAKFGATPEDRQRLRITLATADLEEEKAEARREAKKGGARARRGPHLADSGTENTEE
jgi:hypothetical protein